VDCIKTKYTHSRDINTNGRWRRFKTKHLILETKAILQDTSIWISVLIWI